jgi:hypothetical protein
LRLPDILMLGFILQLNLRIFFALARHFDVGFHSSTQPTHLLCACPTLRCWVSFFNPTYVCSLRLPDTSMLGFLLQPNLRMFFALTRHFDVGFPSSTQPTYVLELEIKNQQPLARANIDRSNSTIQDSIDSQHF